MKQYVVDAFTDALFGGNPAAVCVLDRWPADGVMQSIAIENNLSETAFTVKEKDGYRLRWMTPGGEIDLCGHATLATAFVLMNYIDAALTQVKFYTMSGELTVRKNAELYEMDFPAYTLRQIAVTEQMTQAIGARPKEAWLGRDLVCVMETEEAVTEARPDPEKLKLLEGLLQHITAPAKQYDCVSRSFASKLHVPEDPVCGSGHCHIAPLWAQKLQKKELVARQASKRGGVLYCQVREERVKLAGKAVLYAVAELNLKL